MCQEGQFVIENISFYDDKKLGTELTAEADWNRRGLYIGPNVIMYSFCSLIVYILTTFFFPSLSLQSSTLWMLLYKMNLKSIFRREVSTLLWLYSFRSMPHTKSSRFVFAC